MLVSVDYSTDETRHAVEFCGIVKTCLAGTEDDEECLTFSVDKDGATKVYSFTAPFLNTRCMFPPEDNTLWNYVPAWFFNNQYAVDTVQEILEKVETREFSELKTPAEAVSTLNGRPVAAFRSVLKKLFDQGSFGRYTARMFTSPKASNGMDVYKLVVESCKVTPIYFFVFL